MCQLILTKSVSEMIENKKDASRNLEKALQALEQASRNAPSASGVAVIRS